MTQCRGERLDIGRKTRFTRFDSVVEIHRSLHLKLESPFSQSIANEVYDTVVLIGCGITFATAIPLHAALSLPDLLARSSTFICAVIHYANCDMRVVPALDLLSRTDLRMYKKPVPRCVRGTFRPVGVSNER